MSELPPPPPGLPPQLWAAATGAQTPTAATAASAQLIAWLDGRPTQDLESLLDALRARACYLVSLDVLEAAWNADLPPEPHGRVAEDWLGTVLRGLGDRDGALTVADHLLPLALARGPALAGDLGDLLLTLDLWTAAGPYLEFAAAELPGDPSHRFNLGVVNKLNGDWFAARTCFTSVVRDRPGDRAAHWNLGIAATALHDWVGARAAWRSVGFELPGHEGDFAAPGEHTAVRLTTRTGSPTRAEVCWGVRLCPARVRLTTLPCFAAAAWGDVLLVDGVSAGEVSGEHGVPTPVFPALTVYSHGGAQTFVARSHRPSPSRIQRIETAVARLNRAGWPAADWSRMPRAPGLQIALAVPSGVNPSRALAALEEVTDGLDLAAPELRTAAGDAVGAASDLERLFAESKG